MTEDSEKFKKQLLSKIKIDDNGCWIFQGLPAKGYGEFRRIINGLRFTTAHRASYYLFKGEIPDGMMVLHRCSEDHKKDNPKCINPEHLYCGTAKDNSRDMHIAGVMIGENHPMYGKPGTRLGVFLTDETKHLIGEKQKGEKNHMFGKIGDKNPNFGKKLPYKSRPKMIGKLAGKNNPAAKEWKITNPNNEIFICNDMVTFCKINKINYYSFVTNKKWHKWKCQILKEKTNI